MKKLLIILLTKHLFRWISEDDVFVETPEGITHKRKLLTLEQVEDLRENATKIKNNYFWKVMMNEIRYAAYLHWLKTGEDLSARMLLRAEEIIRKNVEKFAKE